MSDGVLTILKFCLIAVVYLFLARVVWTVSAELRGSAATAPVAGAPAEAPAGPRRGRRWQVRIVKPNSDGRAFAVDGELTIGRGGGCGISVPDDTYCSQVHARVFERDGRLYAEDLGSTNGTRVDDEPITEPRRLRKGDRVQVGATVLEVSR